MDAVCILLILESINDEILFVFIQDLIVPDWRTGWTGEVLRHLDPYRGMYTFFSQYTLFVNLSFRVPVSSLVLASPVSMPKVNHNGTALPTLKSCKLSLRPTSNSSLMLGTWKQTYGFVNVCINASRARARNLVSGVAWLRSLRVHFGYVDCPFVA